MNNCHLWTEHEVAEWISGSIGEWGEFYAAKLPLLAKISSQLYHSTTMKFLRKD